MKTHLWESADGSRAVVLPHGGRILALFAQQSDDNFLWTHPALADEASARKFYAGSWWHNSGGDRTWLAPEYDLFFPDYPKPENYFQPRQLDPGNYRLHSSASGITLKNDLQLQLFASSQTVSATIEKSLSSAANPLAQISGRRFGDLMYAGYTLNTTLTLHESSSGTGALGVWNLLQLPHGGEMFIATQARANVVHFMGEIPVEDLAVSEHLVRYRMHAAGEHKIGVGQTFATGRAAYLYGTNDNAALVVRSFVIDPAGHYVDIPFGSRDAGGSAVQACSVNSALGAFAELEYHSPAIRTGGETHEIADQSVVWAYRGPKSSLLEAARLLVSPEL